MKRLIGTVLILANQLLISSQEILKEWEDPAYPGWTILEYKKEPTEKEWDGEWYGAETDDDDERENSILFLHTKENVCQNKTKTTNTN